MERILVIGIHIARLISALGLVQALNVCYRRLCRFHEPISVRLKGLPSQPRVSLRPVDSDLFVASQVIGGLEYDIGEFRRSKLSNLADIWKANGEVPVIVDGGANVGYSALFFSTMFPSALVLAIEPDPSTFEALESNVGSHHNIVAINAALWSDSNGVSIASGGLGSWSNSVTRSGGGIRVPSYTLSDLLSTVEKSRLLVLKLDIEGGELEVLASSHDLLQDCPCIMLEPHDFANPGRGCISPIFSGLSKRMMDTLIIGENLVFLDSSLLVDEPVEHVGAGKS